jgi:hypothetical protein
MTATQPERYPTTTADTSQSDTPTIRPSIAKYVGGKRGFIDSALPPFAFIAANALTGEFLTRPDALRAAVAAAVATAVGLVVLRLIRKQPRQQAIRGFVGVALAALFAARSGEARDYFLPGIYVDAAWAVAFAVSAMIGRPIIGFIHAALFGEGARWRTDTRLRRAFIIASLGWSAVYATRAGAQAIFYQVDQPGLLAATKLALGWPLTIVAVVATLAYIRRAGAPTPSTSRLSS